MSSRMMVVVTERRQTHHRPKDSRGCAPPNQLGEQPRPLGSASAVFHDQTRKLCKPDDAPANARRDRAPNRDRAVCPRRHLLEGRDEDGWGTRQNAQFRGERVPETARKLA